jgi:hypothetical protein
MTTLAINCQLAAMTPAQFAALPPHLKLQHSAKMPNQFLVNHTVLSRRYAHSTGLVSQQLLRLTSSTLFVPVSEDLISSLNASILFDGISTLLSVKITHQFNLDGRSSLFEGGERTWHISTWMIVITEH